MMGQVAVVIIEVYLDGWYSVEPHGSRENLFQDFVWTRANDSS